MIWENRESYKNWEKLVLLSLEIGLRDKYSVENFPIPFTGGEIHQGVCDMVFRRNDPKAVTDLIWASLMFDRTGRLGSSICTDYIDYCGRVTGPSSQHLQPFC